jgi:DNA-damage-inducible protein D
LEDIPQIRRIWHKETWYYSVIEVIAYLVNSQTPRKYWNTLKTPLKAEGAQAALDEIEALALRSADGRLRETDTAHSETLLRLVKSIPSPRVEPLKQWLAEVGQERIEEVEHPELVLERIRTGYRAKHREERWIEDRIRNVLIRNALTDEWSEWGAREGMEFAILTNELSKGRGPSASPYKLTGSTSSCQAARTCVITCPEWNSSSARCGRKGRFRLGWQYLIGKPDLGRSFRQARWVSNSRQILSSVFASFVSLVSF